MSLWIERVDGKYNPLQEKFNALAKYTKAVADNIERGDITFYNKTYGKTIARISKHAEEAANILQTYSETAKTDQKTVDRAVRVAQEKLNIELELKELPNSAIKPQIANFVNNIDREFKERHADFDKDSKTMQAAARKAGMYL